MMPLPEPANELAATYGKARDELRNGLTGAGWRPVAGLENLISDGLAHLRFRLSASWDHRRDAASQDDLLETFRRVLANEVWDWMRRDGLLEIRSVDGAGEVRLTPPPGRLQDFGLERTDEALALGRRVMQLFDV